MITLSDILIFFNEGLHLFCLKDIVEVLFLSTIIYYFMLWLKKDMQKNLLFYFYGYCMLLFIAQFGEFTTIEYFLFTASPITLMIFIMLHQETLQKNFVQFKRMQVNNQPYFWFDEFMRSCLNALNTNKEIICVIERSDRLRDLIDTTCMFYADLKKDVFEILLEKHSCDTESMIWINQEGKLVAINAKWNLQIDDQWMSPEAQLLYKWKQDCIFVSSKTDAIVIKISPLTRTFDIIMQGKFLEDIAPQQAFAILQRNLVPTQEQKDSATIYPAKQTNKEKSTSDL